VYHVSRQHIAHSKATLLITYAFQLWIAVCSVQHITLHKPNNINDHFVKMGVIANILNAYANTEHQLY
jgi:hypothetical protein